MRTLNVFLFEFKHFRKSKAKVLAYILFVFGCIYAIYNGFSLQNKQLSTISKIQEKQKEEINEMLAWYDEGVTGPEDKPWIDITSPFWALRKATTYTIKEPSKLLPLGIGQAEQYGFYKETTQWSSTYDNDMVEEIANPERLVNGNIDFAFLILFLLPILLIIFTYNIVGLEKDRNFDKLIKIQFGNHQKWVLARLGFYTVLLILTALSIILIVSIVNGGMQSTLSGTLSLIGISILYILCWSAVFYFVILRSKGSSSQAFKMISIWLLFCVVIPGSVHQYASTSYPANFMIDYLDANRKDAYAIYDLEPEELVEKTFEVYPELRESDYGKDGSGTEIVFNTLSAVINEMNKTAIASIEQQNDQKNQLIKSTYWFNPVSFFQNKWNSITSTDYSAYKDYRNEVQLAIDKRNKLLAEECWNNYEVDKEVFEDYLKELE